MTGSGKDSLFGRIALIGAGLIGSSLARVLRRHGLAQHIAVTARTQATLDKVVELDLADSVGFDPAAAAKDADLVVLCTPLGAYGAIAEAIAPQAKLEVVGIRPGEKLHEQMISSEDAPYTYEYPEHFKILPAINNWCEDAHRIKDGTKVPEGFSYASNSNAEWMDVNQLRNWVDGRNADNDAAPVAPCPVTESHRHTAQAGA